MPQPTIFISYSQEDEAEKDELVAQLGVLQHAGLVDVWSDARIAAGSDVQHEVDSAIAQAKVAILLISANFFNSTILDQQLPKLLERHQGKELVIFPVIAKACPWRQVEWLARMEVRPKNGTPVWSKDSDPEKELAQIAEEVASIVRGVEHKSAGQPSTKSGAKEKGPQMSASDRQSEPSNDKNNSKSKNSSKWWIPIAVAIIGLIGTIFAVVWPGSDGGGSDPGPEVGDFTYQVRVQAKDTGENIPNAVVTIEVGGQAPLDGITDSTGLARIFVSASHAGRPGRLLVEADGYERYRQEIDITEGALPKDVLLEPEP